VRKPRLPEQGKRRLIACAISVCILGLGSACTRIAWFGAGAGKPQSPTPARFLPRRLGHGFSLAGAIERYKPDNLWKKIDGGADLFLSYGFRDLLFGAYQRRGAELPEIEVSIYNMGDYLNALGIYLAEKSQDAEPLKLGWDGYESSDGVFFHEGPYYVKVVDLSENASLGNIARAAARRIARAIGGKRKSIGELEVFPAEGMVPNSILYIHRDALGHSFLKRVFKADYKVGGKTVTLFFCRGQDAEALLGKYRDYGREFGRVEREWQSGELHLLSVTVFDQTDLVFARGDLFGGVAGCTDQKAALRLIRELVANIERRFGKP